MIVALVNPSYESKELIKLYATYRIWQRVLYVSVACLAKVLISRKLHVVGARRLNRVEMGGTMKEKKFHH